MANDAHLPILRQGVQSWNDWRQGTPGEIPDLTQADLSGLNLTAVNLAGAKLVGVRLSGTDLTDACIDDANLNRAELVQAKLLRVKARRARLAAAQLSGAYMAGADLRDVSAPAASFAGADLTMADLTGAKLFSADFSRSDLEEVIFVNADLKRAVMTEASLLGANLEGADVRGIHNLILDSTMVRRARFSTRANDPWSILRRTYTGPQFAFTLIFLIAFLLPYVGKAAWWVTANRAQEQLAVTAQELRTKVRETDVQDGREVLERGVEALVSRAPGKDNPRWRESRVWRLIVGLDREVSYWATAFVLIVYNVCRALVTWVVVAMRDEEERSGHTPRFIFNAPDAPPLRRIIGWLDSYAWLIWPHRVVRVLFWFALCSFAWHMIHWLRLPVWIPRP